MPSLPTSSSQVGVSRVTSGNGRAGWRAGNATVSLELVRVPTESRQPSRATIAPSSACGAAMISIGAAQNGTHTQHRPRTRCEPRTGAPCHTPRTHPPGTPTDSHRTDGPGGPHTHSDEDENGHVSCMCAWCKAWPVARADNETSGDAW